MQCACSSFLKSSTIFFVFFNECQRSIYAEVLVLRTRVHVSADPDVCPVCKIAITCIAHFSFGMVLNQMLQVPHRKNVDIGSEKM